MYIFFRDKIIPPQKCLRGFLKTNNNKIHFARIPCLARNFPQSDDAVSFTAFCTIISVVFIKLEATISVFHEKRHKTFAFETRIPKLETH